MGFKGINVRQTGDRLLFRALLQDNTGALITTSTAAMRIYELQNDGTLKSYDFNDNTFKTTALTTATQNLTHRTGNNSTVNTGIWTFALTTVTGFTIGNIYLFNVNHSSAVPTDQVREFQYGDTEGDSEFVNAKVNDGSPTTTGFVGAATGSDTLNGSTNDIYKNGILVFTSGTLKGIGRKITGYTAATKTFVTTAFATAPANGDPFIIIADIE